MFSKSKCLFIKKKVVRNVIVVIHLNIQQIQWIQNAWQNVAVTRLNFVAIQTDIILVFLGQVSCRLLFLLECTSALIRIRPILRPYEPLNKKLK
jgi:hypothetical protein